MVKFALLHGNPEQELCHQEIQKNSINIGKKFMTRNDYRSFVQTKNLSYSRIFIHLFYYSNFF